MISIIKGAVIEKSASEAIIDCGGVGYGLLISLNTFEFLPEIGKEVKLYTLLIPREDALLLFGFYSSDEREVFKLLTSVNGVGAKIALAVLSSISISSLIQAIADSNSAALQKLPGIGKKTADRLVLELKDKLQKFSSISSEVKIGSENSLKSEAVSALVSLGYNKAVAEKAVNKASANGEFLSIEALIKAGLKYALE